MKQADEKGRLSFYVQHDDPETEEQQRKRLPAPETSFRFANQFYGQKTALIDWSYALPRLVRQEQQK